MKNEIFDKSFLVGNKISIILGSLQGDDDSSIYIIFSFLEENMINGRKVAKFRDSCTGEECYTLDIKTTVQGNYATIRQNFNSSSTISEKRSEEVAASFVRQFYSICL